MDGILLTILSLSASGTILALALFALRPFLKNRVSKAFQYYVWLLVLLRLVVPASFDGSIMGWILPHPAITPEQAAIHADDSGSEILPQGPITPRDVQAGTASGAMPGGNAADPALPPVTEPVPVSIWAFVTDHLTALWILGALIHFVWLTGTYLRFSRKIRKTSTRPHPLDRQVFAELRGNANVRLACNRYIDTPMLIGFLSPCVVIPHRAYVAGGMEKELRHILRHELTHHRRRDLLYKWFAVLVSSLHWFNPVMILVRREINRACELSCDEAVIGSLNAAERQGYGETLLSIASAKRFPTGVVTTTMYEERRQLKERLESIMTFKNKSVYMVALSIVITLLLGGCGMMLGPTNGDRQTPEASPPPAATQTPDTSPSSPAPAAAQTPDTPPSSPAPADSESKNTAVYSVYRSALEGVYYDHVFPDGQPCDWDGSMDISENLFAIYDVDQDGREELILSYRAAIMAGMEEIIYDFDKAAQTVVEEFREFPNLTYYDNGVIQAGWSHNQGRAGEFWPYTLYRYDAALDRYVNIGMVDAWDRTVSEEFMGEPFPTQVDADGDGIVYYIMIEGEYRLDDPVDGAEYMKWRDSYTGNALEIQIPFVNLAEENIAAIQ